MRVRPVHEALLRVVPAVVAIVKENAALIRVRHTLDPMVAEWTRAPRGAKTDFLATSPALIAGAAQLDERFGEDLPAGCAPSSPIRLPPMPAAARPSARASAASSRPPRRAGGGARARRPRRLAMARGGAEQKRIADASAARAEAALTRRHKDRRDADLRPGAGVRKRTGMPVDLVRLILDRAEAAGSAAQIWGDFSDLLHSAALGDNEVLLTMLQQSTSKAQADVVALLSIALRFQATMSELVAKESRQR